MKLIDNEVYEYVQKPGIEGVYEAIASAARICYQTDTDKSKQTPKDFVENTLLKLGHTRPMEFGTVYLKLPLRDGDLHEQEPVAYILDKYTNNQYSKTNIIKLSSSWYPADVYVTTNMRVIMQGDYKTDYEAWKNGYDKNWIEDIEKYWCEPTEYHPKRRTFDLILSRGASDDLRTHITLSSMCESTRWCNYSKGKYGNQLTGIKPYWIDFGSNNEIYTTSNEYGDVDITDIDNLLSEKDMDFVISMTIEEHEYMYNAENGLQPQQLKRLFPLWGKCELRLCGFDDAWDNFIWRRLDSHADPECIKIAEMIQALRDNKQS